MPETKGTDEDSFAARFPRHGRSRPLPEVLQRPPEALRNSYETSCTSLCGPCCWCLFIVCPKQTPALMPAWADIITRSPRRALRRNDSSIRGSHSFSGSTTKKPSVRSGERRSWIRNRQWRFGASRWRWVRASIIVISIYRMKSGVRSGAEGLVTRVGGDGKEARLGFLDFY